MSQKLPSLKPKEVIKAFQRAGFQFDHQTGSHIVLRHPETKKRAVIPFHARDIKKGLLISEIKKAGMTVEEFIELIYK